MSKSMMKRSISQLTLALAASGLLFACGGGGSNVPTRSGLGDNKPPPPPKQDSNGSNGTSAAGDKPERQISKDAREDYSKAVAFFKEKSEGGWTKDECSSAAGRFAEVANDHPKLVEAQYMVGRSYHACGMFAQAEKAYQETLQKDSSHAHSLSNLGEIYYQAGKVESAKKYWESAIKADSKIAAARNNLAWLMIQELPGISDRKQWGKVVEDAELQLSSSLAVDSENVKTYTLYALLYLEGSDRNKNRLDLAKLLLDEGEKRDGKFAPLHNAFGLLHMKRNSQSQALSSFEKAVALDPSFTEARMNVGNITLGFRKYDVAADQFSEVLKLQKDNYDALIGLGIAQRGLNKLDDAEASYKKAIDLDKRKSAAYFNLGVLYKDFRANAANGLPGAQEAYKEARKHFRKFVSMSDVSPADKNEAEENIKDCDKIIQQIDDVMKAMAEAEAAEKAAAAGGDGGGQ